MDANEVTVLAALIGVGGTIIGTILGYVLNSWSNRGKISISNIELVDEFKGKDIYGEKKVVSIRTDVDYCKLTLCFNVFNSCNNTKILKQIELNFYNKNNLIFKCIPDDKSTEQSGQFYVLRDKVKPLNITSKSVMSMSLVSFIGGEDIIKLWETNKIKLSYENERNKKKFIEVSNKVFSKVFDQ